MRHGKPIYGQSNVKYTFAVLVVTGLVILNWIQSSRSALYDFVKVIVLEPSSKNDSVPSFNVSSLLL